MRLKLDENLGRRAVELFREAGHEVATVLDQGLGASSDDALLEVCGSEGRALVILDLDFSNVLRFPPARFAGIAVLRVPNPVDLDVLYAHVHSPARRIAAKRAGGTAVDRGARADSRVR